jgi:hypothetical protein
MKFTLDLGKYGDVEFEQRDSCYMPTGRKNGFFFRIHHLLDTNTVHVSREIGSEAGLIIETIEKIKINEEKYESL